MDGYRSAACFPTTHWSRVAGAGGARTPEAHAALTELFKATGTVAAADPAKGRLRSFLLADFSFFLRTAVIAIRHSSAAGRGRSSRSTSTTPRGNSSASRPHERTAERMFERDQTWP